MAEKAEANTAHAVSRLAASGENVVRNLAALPLRMLAVTLGMVEAVLHTAADTLREIDPVDERVVELERRVDSLEKRTGRRKSSDTTSGARKRTPTAAPAAPERGDDTSGHDEYAAGSDTPTGHRGA